MRVILPWAGVACCALAVGCASEPRVARVIDGRVVMGEYVAPVAYAAFMRGAIAEERGDAKEALASYSEVVRYGEDDAEVWTRIGALRCATTPGDPQVRVAFDRALTLDREYGPAWAARARCALLRGRPAEAAADARRSTLVEPMAVEPQVLLARADVEDARAKEVRSRLVALTLVDGSTASWDALAAWGRGHGDAALVAQALGHVAALSPSRGAELGAKAVELAGDGELAAARSLAGAVLDAGGDRSSGGLGPAPASSPLVARLAIDDALVAHDADRARTRAVRAHVGLDVVAARALLLGDAPSAAAIAQPLADADPGAIGVRLVLAAVPGGAGAAVTAPRGPAVLAPEPLLGLARVVARVGSLVVARSLVQAPHEPFVPGDDTLTPALVELAATGVVGDDELPPDARIELAARRLETPTASLLDGADARHRLFALALARPLDPAAIELAKHLAPAAAHDTLVALALVRLSLALGKPVDARLIDRLVARSPTDPLVALAALDVAKRLGDEAAIGPARARLTALARTPGERAHALE
jgi:hypothetical protein